MRLLSLPFCPILATDSFFEWSIRTIRVYFYFLQRLKFKVIKSRRFGTLIAFKICLHILITSLICSVEASIVYRAFQITQTTCLLYQQLQRCTTFIENMSKVLANHVKLGCADKYLMILSAEMKKQCVFLYWAHHFRTFVTFLIEIFYHVWRINN